MSSGQIAAGAIGGMNSTQQTRLQSAEIPTIGRGTFLTADALLAYCESRLRGLDDQVGQITAEQEGNIQKQKILNELMGSLGKYSAIDGDHKNQSLAPGEMDAAYDKAIGDAKGVDPDLANQLTAQKASFDENAKDGIVDAGEMQQFVTNVKNMQSSLSQGSELNMIQLQSLMSQRQMAVQLTTNMMSSLGDSSKAIAANVGRG